MKNPETEAISGFCCNLLFNSAEKEGLFAALMIPEGGASKETRLIRFAHFDFCFQLSSLRQAWLGHLKTKIPAVAGEVFLLAEKEGFEPLFYCIDNELITRL